MHAWDRVRRRAVREPRADLSAGRQVGDTVGGTDLSSVGSGKSTLAMSTADNFIIDGNVSGTTEVVVVADAK